MKNEKIDLQDPAAFIRLRNWDQFQYLESGRPRKTGDQRRRWAKLHVSMLTSADWMIADDRTKVLMVTLITLAAQYNNRIPNNLDYLARVCGWHSPDDVVIPFGSLIGTGAGGFIELTLDARPDEETTSVKAKPRPKGTDKRFDDFWAVYPNRKNKKEARRVWLRDKLDGVADEIIAAVKVQAQHDDWKERDGKFVPLPSTYLNKERWQDVLAVDVPKPAGELGFNDRRW